MKAHGIQNGKWLVLLQAASGAAAGLVFLAMMAGFGNRFGWWSFRQGFKIWSFSFYGAIVAFAFTLILLIFRKTGTFQQKLIWGTPPLILSLVLIVLPLTWMKTARQVPRIHDISTDTEDPPAFVAVVPLRKDAPNAAEYGGKEIADQQKAGYPDLKSEKVPMDADRAFSKALGTAREMGWTIVEADPAQRRIEATDTTFWFGFKDDIVIRILPEEGMSRLDIRSLSRVGISDVGTNAKRIRNFLARFRR